MKARTIVTPYDTRLAVNGPEQCGYCNSRLGEEHETDCICRKHPVLMGLRDPLAESGLDTLTPAERSAVAVAKVAASHETDSLIAIIERLAGEVVPAADGG